MKKKILSLALLLCVLIGCVPIAANAEIVNSGTCGDNLTWTLDDEGTLIINGTGEITNWSSSCDTPWYFSRQNVKNAVIHDGVTRIGDRAFEGCYNLTSITIPSSVTSIGNEAFESCSSLTSITIPNSVTGIGNNAFWGCDSLTSIEIPNSVTGIGDRAFSYCQSLTSITIPDSVISIGDSAFFYCQSLTSITIPSSVTDIGNSAFSYCQSLTNITVDTENRNYCSVNGNLFSKDKTELIQYATGKKDISYTIPSSVTSIGERVFEGCQSLTSIEIPNSVTSIGKRAFDRCDNLTSITIPSSVTSIGDSSFSYCKSLTSITIPDSVISIGYWAFDGCSSLTSITIPSSVTGIGDWVFRGCYNLTSIEIPSSVTSIGYEAFVSCDKLKNIYYSGSEAEWKNIDIYSVNNCLAEATIHYNSKTPVYKAPSIYAGDFNFAPGTAKTASFYYKDHFFADSAYSYNHDLAKMSIRLALSAFAERTGGNRYEKRYKTVENLMATMNFHDFKAADEYKSNSVGIAAARKWVNYPDGDYTVIAAAIRSEEYECYRDGDFNIGSGEPHSEAEAARDQVLDFLKQYVSDNNIYGNVKVWITGCDRAAATANLTAAYLNTHSLIFNGSNTDSAKIIQLKPENIYAYCFETPTCTSDDDRNSKTHNNIFSIVNKHDFTPTTAPNKLSHGRYGITKYLPSAQTSSNYLALRDMMIPRYTEYRGEEKSKEEKAEYTADNFSQYPPASALAHDFNLYNGQAYPPELCMAWLDVTNESNFSDKPLRTLCLNGSVDLEVYDSSNNLVAAIYDNVPQEIEGSSIIAYFDENGQKVVYLPSDEEYTAKAIAANKCKVTYSVHETDIETSTTNIVNYNSIAVHKNDILTGSAENLYDVEEAQYPLALNKTVIAEKEVITAAVPMTITASPEGNGNVFGGGALFKGEYAMLTAAPHENESFLGWYNGSKLISSEPEYRFAVYEDIALTAKFTQNTCAVTVTDGKDSISEYRVLKGSAVTLNENPERGKSVFEGYYSDADFTSEFDTATVFNQDSIIYAKFRYTETVIDYIDADFDSELIVSVNFAYLSESACVYCAVYDNDGRLVSVKMAGADYGTEKVDFAMPNIAKEDFSKIVVFVWRKGTTQKLTEVKEL